MNITVIGAGAIGGHIAAKLAAAGERVKVVARGEHLKAIRERGLTLKENGEEIVARVEATDRIAEAGGADLVVLGVKAHQLTPIAAELASIVTPSTTLMTTQNGISVVVLLQAWRTARGRSARERRSRRGDRSPSADRRNRRRDQLPGGGDRKPGRHPAYRGPSLAGRRNRRPKDRAHRGFVRALHESRLQIAGARRRAHRNLDEALGQSDLQSD